MPRLAVSLPILAALFVSPLAAADEPARDPVAAEALFREGRDLAKRGDYASACPKFAESLRLDRTPGALLNLADCEERTHKLATAWLHYTQLSQQVPPGDERMTVAREHLAALEPRLPRLSISLAKTSPTGSVVRKDGLQLGEGSLGDPLPADPGHHVIVVTAPGFADRTYEIELKEADSRELVVTVSTVREAPPTTSSGPVGGYVLTAIGATSLGVGLITGGLVLGKRSTLHAHCDASDACDPTGLDAASSGKTLSTVSTVTTLVGAAALGFGLYWVLSGSSDVDLSGVGASAAGSGFEATWRSKF